MAEANNDKQRPQGPTRGGGQAGAAGLLYQSAVAARYLAKMLATRADPDPTPAVRNLRTCCDHHCLDTRQGPYRPASKYIFRCLPAARTDGHSPHRQTQPASPDNLILQHATRISGLSFQ